MARLSRADMEAALAFAAEVGSAASQPERADIWLLELISRSIGLESAGYSHHGTSARDLLHNTCYPANLACEWVPTDHEWEVNLRENPYRLYIDRTGDRYHSSCRLSDLVDMRSFSQTELFELSDLGTTPHKIQMRTPDEIGHWMLDVARGGPDFSERDVLLLDAMRPSFIAYEAHRALAEKVAELESMRSASFGENLLSARENEVLDLVAEGASNTKIAERLWISPGTVKKHLEHIYLKLEVGSRTAALAQTGRASAAPERREA